MTELNEDTLSLRVARSGTKGAGAVVSLWQAYTAIRPCALRTGGSPVSSYDFGHCSQSNIRFL